MRPPGAVLAPGETIIATGNTAITLDLYLKNNKVSSVLFWFLSFHLSNFPVFKFVEHPENNENILQKCKVKFKILSLKVKGPMEYAPELVSSFSCVLV
jgi:hypothetical protein